MIRNSEVMFNVLETFSCQKWNVRSSLIADADTDNPPWITHFRPAAYTVGTGDHSPDSLPWLKDNLHKPFCAQQPNLPISFFFMLRT